MPASVTPRTGGSSKRKCRLAGGVAVEGVRKTAGRGTQNCYATVRSQPNSWSGRLEQFLLNYTGWKARKYLAAAEVFFLTFPFIELIRIWPTCDARFWGFRGMVFADVLIVVQFEASGLL